MADALATPGLPWLAFAALLAGLVRGFTGFGTAMVFLPLSARVLPPVEAVLILVVIDLVGPLPTLPKALREGHRPDLIRLGAGMLVGIPFGVAILTRAPPETFRLAVSSLTLLLLVLLLTGVRYRGELTPSLVVGAGGLSGLLGGATALFGPPVILFYMASTLPARAIRANLFVYLAFANVAFIVLLGLNGALAAGPLLIGVVLIVPYALANVAGTAMFRPWAAGAYRGVAYAIIAGSALSGLPIFD